MQEIDHLKTDVEVVATLCLLLPSKVVETYVIDLLGLGAQMIDLFSKHVALVPLLLLLLPLLLLLLLLFFCYYGYYYYYYCYCYYYYHFY